MDRSTYDHLDKTPFLLGSHKNFAFTRSVKQPAPVTDTISASQGYLHTGASTVTPKIIIMSANFFYSNSLSTSLSAEISEFQCSEVTIIV